MPAKRKKSKAWKRLRKALTFDRVLQALAIVVPVVVALIEKRREYE